MRPVILSCIAFFLALVVAAFYSRELQHLALKYAASNPVVAAWEIEDAIVIRPGKITQVQSPRKCLALEADWYIDKHNGEALTGIKVVNRCAEFIDVTDIQTVLPIVGSYGSILPVKALIAPISHKHGIKGLRDSIFFLDKTGGDCKSDMFGQGNRCNKAAVPPDRSLFIEMLLPAKNGFVIKTADGMQLSGKLSGR